MTKTAVAVEIAVLLTVLVVVEWLEHVLTNTRDMFVPAVSFPRYLCGRSHGDFRDKIDARTNWAGHGDHRVRPIGGGSRHSVTARYA